MRLLLCLAVGLTATACGPRSPYNDYTSPERAARSFVEAGRVGDCASVRSALVAAEQNDQLHIDYRDLGKYSLRVDSVTSDQSAVVVLQAGAIRSPLACRKEGQAWKVSIRDSLRCMQEMQPQLLVSAPR